MLFTPGSWHTTSAGVYDFEGVLVASCGTHTIVEGLRGQGFDPAAIASQVAANARLCASALELLAACKAGLATIEHSSYHNAPSADLLRATIAKAEGK